MELKQDIVYSTIDGHLKRCHYNLQELKELYPVDLLSGNVNSYLEYSFIKIRAYYKLTKDKRLLSDYEFAALMEYFASAECNTESVNTLITVMKELAIANDFVLLLILVSNFDEFYFTSPNALEETKKLFNACKLWPASRAEYIKKLVTRLKEVKAASMAYKEQQTTKIDKYLESINTFVGLEQYEKLLKKLLIKLKYDANRILENVPDTGLIEQDFLTLQFEYSKAKSLELYEEYLLRDKYLNKYRNDLGDYILRDSRRVKVPFTKNQFLNGIHSVLEEQKKL